jgi:glycosyltransferase involved in cell wall biosynthesis
MNVSLLIPCFNAGAYLPDLVASIRSQTTAFSEVLCYDDGSTDNTIAVATSLGLSIIHGGTNRGVSHARNQLTRRASSEWIHFQDADDPITPDFLSRMQPLLRADVDVAICDTDWIDADTQATVLQWRYPPEAIRADPLTCNLRRGIGCNTMIIRRDTLMAIGGFDEKLRIWEDADLHIRLAAAGRRYDALGEVAAISIRRSSSLSHDYRASWRCRLSALENYKNSLPRLAWIELAAQAEIAARNLCQLGDHQGARQALALNHHLGGRAPVTRHPVLRVVRPFLGSWLALRIQEKLRSSPSKLG